MNTDLRALCAELLMACETLYKQSVTASHHQTITLSNGRHPIPVGFDVLAQDAVYGDLLQRARAVLAAEADGPALPESREPASVVGQPSDKDLLQLAIYTRLYRFQATAGDPVQYELTEAQINAFARAVLARFGHQPAPPAAGEVGEGPSDENYWQWYTYCPEEGLEMYSDREQAQSAAQSIMGSYEVAAHSDGWHEDMESVSWGMLVPVEQAQVVEHKTADPDSEFDEWVKYELRPARYGHQRDALGDCLTAGPDQSFTTEATNDNPHNPHNYHTQAD